MFLSKCICALTIELSNQSKNIQHARPVGILKHKTIILNYKKAITVFTENEIQYV